MELPTWKGAYCPCHVNPLSMRLFNHARGAKGRLAAASSHVVSRLEPKQEINDCLVFLVFSRSYDAQRLDVLNQVRVQSSYIIIYC